MIYATQDDLGGCSKGYKFGKTIFKKKLKKISAPQYKETFHNTPALKNHHWDKQIHSSASTIQGHLQYSKIHTKNGNI